MEFYNQVHICADVFIAIVISWWKFQESKTSSFRLPTKIDVLPVFISFNLIQNNKNLIDLVI